MWESRSVAGPRCQCRRRHRRIGIASIEYPPPPRVPRTRLERIVDDARPDAALTSPPFGSKHLCAMIARALASSYGLCAKSAFKVRYEASGNASDSADGPRAKLFSKVVRTNARCGRGRRIGSPWLPLRPRCGGATVDGPGTSEHKAVRASFNQMPRGAARGVR